MQSYYHASSTNGTFVATETEPSFQDDEWILKGISDARANPLQKINQGREGCTWNRPWHDLLANKIWHIIINVLAGQKYKEALFAVSGPVCGRERPDSHTFKVSVHFSFYKLHSQWVYKHFQMLFTPKYLYFTFTSES